MVCKSRHFLITLFMMAGWIPIASAQTFTDETFATGPQPTGIVSGDFNHDGLSDLAVTDSQSNQITILLGTGAGQFAITNNYATGTAPGQIVTADFNGDGNLDLATINSDQTLTLLLGNGDGAFSPGPAFTFNGVPVAIASADFDGDGIPDLATVVCSTRLPSSDCSLLINHNNGGATFTTLQTIALPGQVFFPGGLLTDDFNLDGRPDLAAASGASVLIFTDSSSGSFQLSSTVSPPNSGGIVSFASGRLNRDAAPDLVVLAFDTENVPMPPETVFSFLNRQSGRFFQLRSQISAGIVAANVYLGDITGDGLDDLILVGENFRDAGLSFAQGRGNGKFGAMVRVNSEIIGSPSGAILRDFNGDGRIDIAVTSTSELVPGTNLTHVLLNMP
jgi:hypothetical protein